MYNCVYIVLQSDVCSIAIKLSPIKLEYCECGFAFGGINHVQYMLS